MTKEKNPQEYRGEPVCIRCGDGWPICATYSKGLPSWVHSAIHEASCSKYTWGGYEWEGVEYSDVCRICDEEMQSES